VGKYTYKLEYAPEAFRILSESDSAANKSTLCRAFNCSRPTLYKWIRDFPEFREAVETGLEIGKSRWLDRLSDQAFKPMGQVNNGLIKLITGHVYGITEEPDVNIIVNNSVDPEKILRERGIPIPKIGIGDLDDGT
jgi:hypothetical protein